jgi:hypothetical protein
MRAAHLLLIGLATTASTLAFAQASSTAPLGGSGNSVAQADQPLDGARHRSDDERGSSQGRYKGNWRNESRDDDRDDDIPRRDDRHGSSRFGSGAETARPIAAGAARFRLRRGDTAVEIRCPGGTDLSACVDAAGRLMDRLTAAPATVAPQPPAPVTR